MKNINTLFVFARKIITFIVISLPIVLCCKLIMDWRFFVISVVVSTLFYVDRLFCTLIAIQSKVAVSIELSKTIDSEFATLEIVCLALKNFLWYLESELAFILDFIRTLFPQLSENITHAFIFSFSVIAYTSLILVILNVLVILACVLGTWANATWTKKNASWFWRKYDITEAHFIKATENYVLPFMVYYTRAFCIFIYATFPIICTAAFNVISARFSWGQHAPTLISAHIMEAVYFCLEHFIRTTAAIHILIVIFYAYPAILFYLIACSVVPFTGVVIGWALTTLIPTFWMVTTSVLFFAAFKLIIKIVCLLVAIAYYTLAERKIMASVQRRAGPNVVGLWGLLQPLADGLKLFGKEFIIPTSANSAIFVLAPMGVLGCAFMAWQAVPFCLVDTSTRGLSDIQVTTFLLLVA